MATTAGKSEGHQRDQRPVAQPDQRGDLAGDQPVKQHADQQLAL
jgi:hypothetical protein